MRDIESFMKSVMSLASSVRLEIIKRKIRS